MTSKTCVTSMDVSCNYSHSNSSCRRQTEVCVQREDRVSHCFALYQNSSTRGMKILKMGCWLQDLKTCSKSRRCDGAARMAYSDRREVLYFCCCTGDNCNAKILGGTDIVIRKNRSEAGVTKTDKPIHSESVRPKTKLEENVLVGTVALACGLVVIAATLCICRYAKHHRSKAASERDRTCHGYNLQISTTGSSEMSSDSCVSIMSPKHFQLIRCLVRSRLGEIWIARLPPSPEEIKIKICRDSVVQIYDSPKVATLLDI